MPNITHTFDIISAQSHYYPKFKITGEEICIKFVNSPLVTAESGKIEPLLQWLHKSFSLLLENSYNKIKQVIGTDIKPQDRVGIKITNNNFPDKPLHISFRRSDQLTPDVILNRFEAVVQSNENFILAPNLRITVDHIPMPIGTGGRKINLFGSDLKTFAQKKSKHGIINYVQQHNDPMCLAYSIVLAKARADGKNIRLMLQYPHILKEKAITLCSNACVDLSNGGSIDEIRKFQDFFQKTYRIVVYDGRSGKLILFEDKSIQKNSPRLNILFENNHFYPLKSLTAAFAVHYYCEECHVSYSNIIYHRKCKNSCCCCLKSPPCKSVENLQICVICGRGFRGEECFKNHERPLGKGKSKPLCDTLKKCIHCKFTYIQAKASKHVCNTSYCKTCKLYRKSDHLCFMQPYETRRKVNTKFLYIFYDFECTQNITLGESTNKFLHIPNLCIAHQTCNSCFFNENLEVHCDSCGFRKHIFSNENCVSTFLTHFLKSNVHESFDNIIFIAHNMSGYDGHLILNFLYKNGGFGTPNVIINGTKIISIHIGKKVKFIDSLNYFGCALAKLPKMFNIPTHKGFYPHLFNTTDNLEYIGDIPDLKYFAVDSLSADSRKELLDWHMQQKEQKSIFNNREKLKEYCDLDVKILRIACLKFLQLFWEENKIDPFLDANTIASACNKVFKSNYLQHETIGIIPKNGYRFSDNQSYTGLKWLIWMEHSKNIKIQHSGRGKEVVIQPNLKVDGYHSESNTVYEFLGCYFHGCIKCYTESVLGIKSEENKKNIIARRENTAAKLEILRNLNYIVVFTYECDFKNQILENPEIDDIVCSSPLLTCKPLNPRDAFFGGRTNASKLYHKAENGEKIYYLDICSLYPYINKYFKYPIGHPTIITGEDCDKEDLNTFDGLLTCLVLPPKYCYFPVLPAKMHNKLMFFLCRQCAIISSQDSCSHSDIERSFTGTWVIDEVREAIKQGYTVLKVYEMWKYTITQYDKNLKSGGLFAEYVNKFYMLKASSSGWPEWCTDDFLKHLYIESIKESEGVTLDSDKIQNNPGLRALAKLQLNSFWGKFGQRENMTQVAVIDSHHELAKRLADPSVEVQSYVIINDEKLLLSYKQKDEAIQPLDHVNVVIAAYTTTGARLELYKYLSMLGIRVLYYDTDSIIYTQKDGETSIPTSEFLGSMTNELNTYGPHSYITEFVSGGPKNYAFRVFSPSKNESIDVCKVKGITLNFQNAKQINFATIKDMVLNTQTDIFVEENKILRTHDSIIFSTKRSKKYNVCYTKRRRTENFETLPFGFVGNNY